MGERNKLVRGMLYGAAVGAAVSLLDRETREKTILQMKDCSKRIWNFSKNPSVFIENVSNKIEATRNKVEEVSEDIAFIVDKVNDIKQSSEKLLIPNSEEGEKQEDY
ncbi:YtxH domain-containing protein [Schinkia sp. CFF1]